MHRLRPLIVGTSLLTLLLGMLAVPVAAADTKGTLALVNGIPGHKVDVCLNGRELKSALPYGGHVFRDVVPTGSQRLAFYKSDPRTCRGTVLAARQFPLGPGDDLTIVATKLSPKVVIFDNAGILPLGEIPPKGTTLGGSHYQAFRQAADLLVNFRVRLYWPNPEIPWTPNANAIWFKGDEHVNIVTLGIIWELRATLPEDPETIAIATVQPQSDYRHEWVLVGTRNTNARFVVLDRKISNQTD